MTTIGSICSGVGALDMAVAAHYHAGVAWHAELEPAAATVLAHRYPNIPNIGDLTTNEWPAVDICGTGRGHVMTVSIRDGALVDRPDKDRRGGVANYPVATVRIDHAGLTVDVYISVRGVTAECRSDSGAHSTEWMSFLYEPEEED